MNWKGWLEVVSDSKAVFADLIRASAHEISIHTSLSHAIYSISTALDYSGYRNKIIVTEADFPTVIFIWKACRRLGFELDVVPVRKGGIDLNSYDERIDDRTLVTCVPHVYYQNGFKQDIRAIGTLARKRGSLFCVDAYQSLGTEPIDVEKDKIDFLACGNLKYLLGIPGVAYLYVRRDILPRLEPMATGWFGQENPFSFDIQSFVYAGDSRRMESGTPPVIAAYAARAGMEIISEVGPDRIKDWIDHLSRHTLSALEQRGLKTTSPEDTDKKSPVTAIEVPQPQTVETRLKEKGVIASARGNVIRFAPHFFTTPDDIDRALDILEKVLAEGGRG
jgi:selenocysteine lyase/cysteine desulfurase